MSNLKSDLADYLEKSRKNTNDKILKELDLPASSISEKFVRLQSVNDATAIAAIIDKYVLKKIQELENRINGINQ